MNRRASTILKLGASAAALLATPAMAQTAPADAAQSAAAETAPDTRATPPQDNGDIVVTARRRVMQRRVAVHIALIHVGMQHFHQVLHGRHPPVGGMTM